MLWLRDLKGEDNKVSLLNTYVKNDKVLTSPKAS